MTPPGATNEQGFMHRALELAAAVDPAAVTPNPRVGAVLARDGVMLGEAAHAQLGGLHAERAALVDCESRGNSTEGATLYVTLEPCAHEGRQPPCAEAILAAGISRVVIASDDPSEKTAGRGPRALAEAGVEVRLADADAEEAVIARALNQPFRKHARTGLPLVTLKLAMSLDGRAATSSGDSKWISCEESRDLVHRWRAASDAVAVGIGTALADDTLLTARGVDAPRQPLRVVFDSDPRLPPSSRLLATTGEAPVLVVVGPGADASRVEAMKAAGAAVMVAPGDSEAERLGATLAEMGRREVTSLLVEGGPILAAAFLAAGEVDVIRQFIAPVLLGGGRIAMSGPAVARVADGQRALAYDAERVGSDVLLTARLREW